MGTLGAQQTVHSIPNPFHKKAIAAFVFLLLFLIPTMATAMMRVYVIAGQSNAEGAARSSGLTENRKRIPANVEYWFKVRKASTFADFKTYGIEVTLAWMLSKTYPRDQIVIIKFAVGGTRIKDWDPDDPDSYYWQAVEDVRNAVGGRKHTLCGVIWIHGETDCKSKSGSAAYGTTLGRIIHAFRNSLGSGKEVPFLLSLVEPPYGDYTPTVQQAQIDVVRTVAKTCLIPTWGIARLSKNKIHFSGPGLDELAERIARYL